MDVIEAIKTRRSIRQYKPDPVDNKTLQTVLEAARWAPSWKNTQCWRFIVVRDRKTKTEIADCLIKSKRGDILVENGGSMAVKQAPLLIVACAELGKTGLNAGEFATDKGDWYMFDTALAMQNLVLAAHSLGLGTVHLGLFDAKKVAEILNVPDGFCVVSMTPLGYPGQETRTPPRKELSEIIFHDRFGILTGDD